MPYLELYVFFADESDLDYAKPKLAAVVEEAVAEMQDDNRFDGNVHCDGWEVVDNEG